MAWNDDGYLYHYTNARALLNIVEQRKIWATQSDFLNDALEGVRLNRILAWMIDRPESFVGTHVAYDPRHLAALEQQLRSGVLMFVAAFSKRPNMLTQFRMYCPSTGGFVIGFPREYLRKAGQLIDVKYNEDHHLAWCRDYFIRYMTAAQQVDSPGKEPVEIFQDVERRMSLISERCEQNIRCKSAEFVAEEEVRLVRLKTSPTHVRPSTNGSLLIPYVEIDLPNDEIQVKVSAGPGGFQALAGSSIGQLHNAALRAGTHWKIAQLGIGEFGFREI